MPKSQLLFLLAFLLCTSASAQGLAGAKNQDRGVLISAGYGVFQSAGDLADRFGNGFAIDGGVSYLGKKTNWEFGVRANYGFGNQVNEDVVADLRTDQGFIIGNMRDPADIQLRQRQLFVGPMVGYTFGLGASKRSGINVRTSVGYFFSRIRVQQDAIQGVEPLQPERLAGYDRLTGGPAIYQFVGYQILSENKRINFYAGADLLAGFTKPLRAFDIPTGGPLPDEVRTDVALGARVGIVIPIYIGEGREIYYK
ncbi:hypothetical protein [Lewinella sp. 4G2]|uniref:hypothetical protein n=1 Tax=Lewinella sp. 4G2 TaxID=1803372 RepID=UPI0007B46E56|nr:hypothetical protein [Lewinella sp. 4G2]OAV44863.1 hypothetical protein A3850_010330 [Lewinella sp. 4G2]